MMFIKVVAALLLVCAILTVVTMMLKGRPTQR